MSKSFASLVNKKRADEKAADNQVGAFVRGETDKLPDKLPPKAEKPKPRSFAEMAARSREKPKEKEPARDELWGTGLTKRLAESAAKQAEKRMFEPVKAPEPAKPRLPEKAETAKPAPKTINVQFAEDKDITLDEYQAAALAGIKDQRFACLIGAAGTGKTTVTKQLISMLINDTETIADSDASGKVGAAARAEGMPEAYIPAIAACAYTGTATENVKKALGREFPIRCDTIHGLLGFYPIKETYFDKDANEYKDKMKFIPYYDANNKMPWKVILIDEAGMLGIDLWHQLLDASLPDCRIIMIGDINQLPPVQGRSVLGFAMLKWPTFALEKIHRQAADSPIIANAHRILKGVMPQSDGKKFLVVPMSGSGLETFKKTINLVKALDQKNIYDPLYDALITSVNGDTLGQQHFNQMLLPYFNVPQFDENGVQINQRYTIYGGRTQCAYAVGDKVMVLSNDRPRGITNGMTGVVIAIRPNENYMGKMGNANLANFDISDEDIDFDEDEDWHEEETDEDDDAESKRQASHVVTVRFAQTDIEFKTSGDFGKLTHAYAFTCHKSQGKEYPNVIIVAHSKNARMMSREWLYTAVTRAQERVFLCANDRGLAMALRRQAIKGNTIKEKAESFIALMDKADTRVPELPEPKQI